MKKNILFAVAIVSTFIANAQQNNTLLDASFWKKSPSVTTVQAEISKGNNYLEFNDRAFDPIVLAIINDAPTESIEFLINQNGVDVNKSTHDNRIYLHWAAYSGNDAIVSLLLDKGSNINAPDSHGTTPITFAANAGQSNTKVYDALFKAGINPATKYNDGANLLLLAISNDKDLVLTKYFVSKGMSLQYADTEGKTAFDYAARSGNIALLKNLISQKVKYTNNAVLFAAEGSRRETNKLDVYQYLINDLKLNAASTNTDGQTALHFVSRKPNQIEIINFLLENGVPVDKADKEGNTALMAAATAKDAETLTLLLSKTQNVNTQNLKGQTALTRAVQSGTPQAVTVLLTKGASSEILDKDDNNLGVYLIESYKPESVRGKANTGTDNENPFTTKLNALQSSGLNLALAQKDGSTLYHYAVLKNDVQLLKGLANLKIDINAQNKNGLTALHKAALIASDDTIMKFLIEAGANTKLTTEFEETAFDLAQENEALTSKKTDLEFLK
ncbi:MAG: ankyrin repeat domain-containing protein [Bacteroidetes bacterium]|nr:ankyrin repeat domain-containing protein [Bacteroidota bacterium]